MKWQSYILKFLPIILVFFVGFGVGYYVAPHEKEVVTKYETKYVEVEGKTKTQIQYVEKTSKNDADVEIKNTNPTVQINDKKYTLEKLPDEKYKFENGKL